MNISELNSFDNFAGVDSSNLTFYQSKHPEENLFSFKSSEEIAQEQNIDFLNEQLQSIEDKSGVFQKGWNKVKEFVGVGATSEKCDIAIEKYKNNEITFEEALEEVEKFASKQNSSLDLFSNIATGVAAIVVTSLTGGVAAPVAIGALTGAVTKSAFKTVDRATNEVEGDAMSAKQIAKDSLSGALTGAIGVKTAGTAGTPFSSGYQLGSKSLSKTAACVAKCAETGLKTGAITGAANYTIDCALENDKQFKVGEFVSNTATSSLVGGTVGAIMGGFNGTLRTHGLLSSGGSVVDHNTASDIVANSLCNAEYKVVNSAVRSVAS